jgi:hypothetical protein
MPSTPPGTPKSQSAYPGVQAVFDYVRDKKQAGEKKLTPYQFIQQVAFNEKSKVAKDAAPSRDDELKITKRYWDKVVNDRNKPEQLQQFKQWQADQKQLNVPATAVPNGRSFADLYDEQKYEAKVHALLNSPTISGLLDTFKDQASEPQKPPPMPKAVPLAAPVTRLPTSNNPIDELRRNKMKVTAGSFRLLSNSSNKKAAPAAQKPFSLTSAFKSLGLGNEPGTVTGSDQEPTAVVQYPNELKQALQQLSADKNWAGKLGYLRRLEAATEYMPYDYVFIEGALNEVLQHHTASASTEKFIREEVARLNSLKAT